MTHAPENDQLSVLISRIAECNARRVSVAELYGKWPEELGISEMEVRLLVNEGIAANKLGLIDLTSSVVAL